MDEMCVRHDICTQQRRFVVKEKVVLRRTRCSVVKTNTLQTVERHSAGRKATLCGSRTGILQLAAQKLYRIHTEVQRNSLDFDKFLVTGTTPEDSPRNTNQIVVSHCSTMAVYNSRIILSLHKYIG